MRTIPPLETMTQAERTRDAERLLQTIGRWRRVERIDSVAYANRRYKLQMRLAARAFTYMTFAGEPPRDLTDDEMDVAEHLRDTAIRDFTRRLQDV